MKQKIAELINIIFGFRKFLLMLILYIVGIVFRVLGYINGAEMVELFSSTTVAFMAANGVEHLMTTVKDYMSNGKPAAPVQVADTDESNDEDEVNPVVPG